LEVSASDTADDLEGGSSGSSKYNVEYCVLTKLKQAKQVIAITQTPTFVTTVVIPPMAVAPVLLRT
jgi:hypothetical protein